MAAKFFTGLPVDGPDPECVLGHGETLVSARSDRQVPAPAADHSRPVPRRAARACEEHPLTGLDVIHSGRDVPHSGLDVIH
jgi:mycofactocin biosynthetic radical S-adenosylmethionine protein MftC